mgnify:CR=1 FL=1
MLISCPGKYMSISASKNNLWIPCLRYCGFMPKKSIHPNWEEKAIAPIKTPKVLRLRSTDGVAHNHELSCLIGHIGDLLVDIYTAKCGAYLHFTVVLNDGGKGAQFRRNGCSIWAVEVRNLARNTHLKVYDQQEPSEESKDDYVDGYGVLHQQIILVSYNKLYSPKPISPSDTFFVVGLVIPV